MGDEFTSLLEQIGDLTTQLATIISKSEYLTRDIASLCEDRKRIESEVAEVKQKAAAVAAIAGEDAASRKQNRDDIVILKQQIAILETKADYAAKTCDGLAKTVSIIQEVNWKTVGFCAGASAAISLMMPWVIKLAFA